MKTSVGMTLRQMRTSNLDAGLAVPGNLYNFHLLGPQAQCV
jgi:hypothetical protein